MSDQRVLFIDNRERSGLEKLIIKYLDKNNLNHQMRQTMITDYSFADVGIEAKTIQDYMQSLYSGHLDKQLQNLEDNYNHAYLVIHGTLDKYVGSARRGGKKIPFQRAFASFTTYRLLRKTATEDMRIDILQSAGCSVAIAKRLLDEHGSIFEIASLSAKELMATEGIGKVRAERIVRAITSEEEVPQERVKMSRA